MNPTPLIYIFYSTALRKIFQSLGDMVKKVIFIKNALILTATSLLLRLLGVFFKVWLAKSIGSEGIGLYQLIFSFYVLVATFATGGISTAVTRLVADELILGRQSGIKKIMKRSFALTVIIAAFSCVLIFVFAEPIAKYFIGNIAASLSLRALSFSLFFMGISSCIKGYFIARRKTLPPSSSQIFEQIIRLVSAFWLISRYCHLGIVYSCAAVLLADTIAELASCIYLYLFYRRDLHSLANNVGRFSPPFSVFSKITHIAGPITSGRYINSALRTIENILVPKKLMDFGCANSSALAFFGMVKGMALPILFFPSTLLNSITTLLIPEISEAAATNKPRVISRLVYRVIKTTLLVSLIFGVIFFVCGEQLGLLIYDDASVGTYIKYLAPLVPLMYLDSISDGILKGLDLQMATFRHSVFDSSTRIILIYLLVPIYGQTGFLAIMYFSNLLTCFLNMKRLLKEARVGVGLINNLFFPTIYAIGVTLITAAVLGGINLSNRLYVVFVTSISLILYITFLFITKTITKEEIQELIR